MARFRLSSDLLSPLNSDISLNDGSAFSFGSLTGTPVFDRNFASPICSENTKDTDINFLCTRNMKECVDAFGEETNDIRKQLSLNSEKGGSEGMYEDLKKSMDDLFGDNSNSSQLKHNESKNENLKSKMHSEKNTVDKLVNSENIKCLKKNRCPNPESIAETTKKNYEKYKKETSATNNYKQNQYQSKRTSSISESVKSTKNKHDVHVKNDILNEKKDPLIDQKKNSKIMSSKSDGECFENKEISSKILHEKKKEKQTEVVKKYHFKCQKKIPVSNNKPVVEHKGLSIEKSIQLTVSTEMDNIRRFVLDQNLCVHKDLLKLQEALKKQNEVTHYLFSVIDELLDTNKKLISKCD